MIPDDFFHFTAQFRRLSAALDRYKQDPEQVTARMHAYFDVLKPFALGLVTAKADAWLAKESKFPTPAQWAGIVVRSAPEWLTLTPADADEYGRAIALGYEDQPCACALCVLAGVTEKPLRYVPTLDRDDEVIRKLDLKGRPVVAGHWAHGYELARYYQAVADFWDAAYRTGWKGPRVTTNIGETLAAGLAKHAGLADPQTTETVDAGSPS